MLEDIRTKMMTRIVQKMKLYNGWKRNYRPLVKAKFDANKKDYVYWQLIWNGENGSHNGLCAWGKTSIKLVLRLIEKKMPGRPKKNRRIAKDEPKKLKPDHLSRKGLFMTCTQCGQHGHNKGFCTKGNKHAK
ncbi:hypothetical protein CXB51_010184 [Gossypium anomalum]|uniref:CCHC-type domain-containing protein n=1 Tax=Gossypium anomalum TaxID=47600 RepID=A0A8J5ZCS1_9ROSI|nr:hypothetical protein CXB51_010184 [Gossypium anomalum]